MTFVHFDESCKLTRSIFPVPRSSPREINRPVAGLLPGMTKIGWTSFETTCMAVTSCRGEWLMFNGTARPRSLFLVKRDNLWKVYVMHEIAF